MKWLKHICLAALLSGLAVLPHRAHCQVDFNKIEADLAGTYSILLKNGSRQSGRILSFDENSLRLEIELGVGSAEMNLTAEQIVRVAFPGDEYLPLLREWADDPQRIEDSLRLYRAFYKQRGPFIQYMDRAELDLFIDYAHFALKHNDALMAVSIINVLKPYLQDEVLIRRLEDTKLLALFRGGMVDEAEIQVRQWIDSVDPASSSALGWSILAEIFYNKEAYEDAFWTALYPVAFSGTLATEHLDTCYALAVAAAQKTRQHAVAQRLHAEMLERNLNWPGQIPALAGWQPAWLHLPSDRAMEGESESTQPNNQAGTVEEKKQPAPAAGLVQPTNAELKTPEPPVNSEPSTPLPTRLPQFSQ